MRSIPLMAVTTVVLASAWACGGDDGGNVGPDNPPVADFTAGPNCTAGAACQFTSTSTDDHGITSYSWNFGDPNASQTDNTSTQQNPTHTYSQAGQYTVTLTVTDGNNASNTKTNNVTIGGGTTGQPPVASFELPDCTAGTPCGFHSTSTDPDGEIANATFAWNFGDQSEPGEGADVTHTFGAAGTYNVQLTVTDEQGNSNSVTQALTVNPAASQDCTTNGGVVDCTLTVNARATVKLSVTSRSCELTGNRLEITAPRQQVAFFNLCARNVGDSYTVVEANGTPTVFAAGSQLSIRFVQGTTDPNDPPTGDAGIQISGTYPTWTLNIDDGGAAGTAGEPDFNDAVVSVQATLAP